MSFAVLYWLTWAVFAAYACTVVVWIRRIHDAEWDLIERDIERVGR